MASNPINDILFMSLEDRKKLCSGGDEGKIQTIEIDGNVFTGYKTFSAFWELTYSKSPERSTGGVIGNLNSIPCFTTPHLKINYAMLSIEDYRRLYGLILDRREFTVKYYDPYKNERVTEKMYFAPDQLPQFFTMARHQKNQEWVEVLGVQNYTIELIGTNNELDTVDIFFYDENGERIFEATKTVSLGEQVEINYNYTPIASGKKFDSWGKEDKSTVYNGTIITANTNLMEDGTRIIKLKAIVVDNTAYKLSLDYGLGKVPVPQISTNRLDIFDITSGQTISEAIEGENITLDSGRKFVFPSDGTGIEDGGYTFKGWYLNSQGTGVEVTGETKFDYKRNVTIYQIYKPNEYTITYEDKEGIYNNKTQKVEYNTKVSLPILAKQGEKFLGWYDGKGNEFSGTMPANNITLYAKWE